MTKLTILVIVFISFIILTAAFTALAYVGSVKKIKTAWKIGFVSMYGCIALCGITFYAMIAVALSKGAIFVAQILQ